MGAGVSLWVGLGGGKGSRVPCNTSIFACGVCARVKIMAGVGLDPGWASGVV